MHIELRRLFTAHRAQVGLLWIDSNPACFTLEDMPRTIKVPGETCIPAGLYQLTLRTHGRVFDRYAARYPWNEHGMLEVMSVPGFDDVLMHCGNSDVDTRGCVLLGDGASCNRGELIASLDAYRRVYALASGALRDNERVLLEVYAIERQRTDATA